MTTTLDDRDATYDGIMRGEIPAEFRELICTGIHNEGGKKYTYYGWTRNPLDSGEKDEHIWVCGACKKPSRVALLNCLFCEQWFYDTRLAKVNNRSNESGQNVRNNYICEGCGG